jgi:hemolysin activation/secretion protein
MNILPQNFRLNGTLKLQHVLQNKNLDSSERMPVGGSAGVMGYPSGELIGSNAALARVELAQILPAWAQGLDSSWSVFTDWGQAAAAKPLSALDERRSIRDIGLGWAGNYQGFMFKAQVAHRLSDQAQSEPYANYKLLIQAGMAF